MKNVVVLNQFVGPTTIDTVNALCDAGMVVDLYAGNIAGTTATFRDGVRVHRRCRYRRSTTLQRLWTWSWFTIVVFCELLLKGKPFQILAVTNPPLNTFTALLLHQLRGIPYHLLVFDVYPDVAVQTSSIRQQGPIVKLWSYLNRLSLKHAQTTFTISERMAEALAKYASPETVLEVVHNWTDNQLIQPIAPQDNLFLKELGLQQKRIVLYSGNFGKTHDILSIVEAARQLISRKDIHFLLIGDGEQKAAVDALVAQYQLKNLTLLPFTDSQVFPYSIASGEIAIVTLDAAAAYVSTPSKTYNSMAAGSAIIALAAQHSELSDLVQKHHMGVVVAPGDARGLAAEIEQLFADTARLQEYRYNARLASNDYTPRNAQSYVRALSRNA